jgi:thymidylate synthase (FAD)
MRETVPIFVARQRFKHMVGFTYNEVSRRYVDDAPEFFVPEVWRSRPDGSVKQGSGLSIVERIKSITGRNIAPKDDYSFLVRVAASLYLRMVEGKIAPEQARMVLPQSMYTSYYVTGSLAAWKRAYVQRTDAHAQQEIRELAEQWNTNLKDYWPLEETGH